jgi:hypothetical protein
MASAWRSCQRSSVTPASPSPRRSTAPGRGRQAPSRSEHASHVDTYRVRVLESAVRSRGAAAAAGATRLQGAPVEQRLGGVAAVRHVHSPGSAVGEHVRRVAARADSTRRLGAAAGPVRVACPAVGDRHRVAVHVGTYTVCVSVSTVSAEQGSELDLADRLVVVLQGALLRKIGGHAVCSRASAPGCSRASAPGCSRASAPGG